MDGTAKVVLTGEDDLTQAQIREVPCIKCDAAIYEHCKNSNQVTLFTCHTERYMLRKKMPAVYNDLQLDATDKALICYYGFVLISDSVAANSEKLMGKKFSSLEVQQFFVKHAIGELIKDGLIGRRGVRNG